MTLLLENPQPNHRRTSQAHKKQPSFAHQFQLNFPEVLVISFSKRRSSLAAFNPKKVSGFRRSRFPE
ncbi:hypothetical protein [Arthrobacter sp. GMC3]|uniref:hypothetical protein n=1 Tax=Arthrobacter sp. GMC3 TaxID=2058894 RepID=UPI000CE4DAC5|nr:hypothetical protein [Arthrobacter sp. GMC3]